MAAPRFFTSVACLEGMDFELEPDDAHHAAHVLRVQPGERIVVVDPHGAWDARITTVEKRRVRARIAGRSDDVGSELPVSITVLQALTKGAKFDEVVEKCVELGARRIVPVACERSYGNATPARIDRWRRIARAAAQQSRRKGVPFVTEAASWNEAIALAPKPLIVGWERAPRGTLASALDRSTGAPEIAVAVGPEGSLTEQELDAARAAGALLVSLGPTILRTETAAAAFLAAINARVW